MDTLGQCKPVAPNCAPDYATIERLFFGYRDFVGVADDALKATGYGRAHHRVLHFVDRHPGLTVGELLKILRITKQAANRVIRQLEQDGHLAVAAGTADRREKHLTTTQTGRALARKLATLQTARIADAFASLPEQDRVAVASFLDRLVDAHERDSVRQLIGDDR